MGGEDVDAAEAGGERGKGVGGRVVVDVVEFGGVVGGLVVFLGVRV